MPAISHQECLQVLTVQSELVERPRLAVRAGPFDAKMRTLRSLTKARARATDGCCR